MLRLLIFILFFTFSIFAEHKLTIIVENIRKEKGDIRIFLFDSETHYLSAKGFPFQRATIRAQKPSIQTTFSGLITNEYAIKVYQDKNLDGKMDTNSFSAPKEPYGFSNNIRWAITQPPFDLVKFEVKSDTVIVIRIK